MNKSDLISAAAQASGVKKKDAERVLNAALDIVIQSLRAGDRIQLSGFGTFEVRDRGAKVGRDPVSRKTIEIPPARVPAFRPSKNLKDTIGR